jgi:catechol 2,3-dioxygenase-like lactoylglutathione lyase family enzyme
MRQHLRGIDHVVILVGDLDQAARAYAAMGFTLTPRGHHTLGSQNHCIMFGTDYVELLAVPRPHPAMQYFTDFLARGEGLGAIAFASDDAAAAQREFAAAGIAADAPLDFSRPVRLGAESRDARFRIVQLPVQHTPGCRTFVCQHFTREVVWRPEFQAHEVGATGLAGIAVVAEEPAAAAQGYAQLLGERAQPIADGLRVDTGSAPVTVGGRQRFADRLRGAALPPRPAPLVAALFISVSDRARAAAALRRGGLAPVQLADGSCAVGADRAHGVALVFG